MIQASIIEGPPTGRYTREHKVPKARPYSPAKMAHCQPRFIQRNSQVSSASSGQMYRYITHQLPKP